GLIGFFVNTLPIRLSFSGDPSVVSLIERVRASTLEAQSNQDLPFEQIVELVNPVRSMAHSPLFQVMFAWQSQDEGELDLPGIDVEPLAGTAPTSAKFDLLLSLSQVEGGVVGGLEYATALFDPRSVERILRCYRRLLEGMVADELASIERLPLLSAADRQLVVDTWNRTSVELPRERGIHELFE